MYTLAQKERKKKKIKKIKKIKKTEEKSDRSLKGVGATIADNTGEMKIRG